MPRSSTPPEPTLTNVTKLGRDFVKYGVIALVVLIFGRILLTAFVKFWAAMHPEPPPPPTVGFGQLPRIVFPVQSSADKPKSYRLETANSKLPYISDRAKVFLVQPTAPSLLSDQRAKEIAAVYDFIFEPEVLNERTYRWTKTAPFQAILEVDPQDFTFSLKTDYQSRPELIVNASLPEEFEAVSQAKDFLETAGLLPEDMATSSGQVTYLKSLGTELDTAVSISDADFVQVDLNRVPVDDLYEMYTPKGTQGTVRMILTGLYNNNDAFLDVEYNYHALDYGQIETYPIIGADVAWKILQAGEAYVANAGLKPEAVVREVVLGYYDDFEEQEYLLPIYVFSGDDGFLAYVPAVDSTYLIK